MEKLCMRLRAALEILHPLLLLPLFLPAVFMLLPDRTEENLLPLYAAGWLLLPLSCSSRLSIRRIRSLGGYLLLNLLVLSISLLAGWTAFGRSFSGGMLTGCLVVLICGGILLFSVGILTRMREYSRREAIKNNDITWDERIVFMEKPSFLFLIWFVLVYLLGIFTECPPLCDSALLSAVLYLLILVCHRYLDRTDRYLEEVGSLANVPRQKIHRVGMGVLLLFLLLVAAACIPAAASRGLRRYHDLRGWEPPVTRADYENAGSVMPSAPLLPEAWSEAFPEGEPVPDPSPILEAIVGAAGILLLILLAFLLIRGIMARFLMFREGFEENGDVVRSLEPEDVTLRLSRRFSGKAPEEPENLRIRREYKRVIRKYRRDTPLPFETPSEIEAAAAFPDGYDSGGLHERYEKARYGTRT